MNRNCAEKHGNEPLVPLKKDGDAAERFYNRRLRFLFIFCAVFIIAGTLMLLRPVLIERDEILQESDRLSLVTGIIPAVRGSIIGEDGTVLAWSERKVALYCTLENPAGRERSVRLAASVIDGIVDDGPENPIRSDLTPVEYSTIRPVISRGNGLRAVSRTERRYAGGMEELAGAVDTMEGGVIVGISGWEAEYEETLSGVPGRFQVNVDPDGNWIKASFKVTLAPVQGEDVIVAVE